MNRLFVRHLTNLDFTYLHADRGLVGETWIVDLELAGELDHQGMVFDFGLIKRHIRDAVESTLDHRLVIPEDLPGLEWTTRDHYISVSAAPEGKLLARLTVPEAAAVMVPGESVDPDAISDWIASQITHVLPDNAREIRLRLYPEFIQGASYHYTHGLKKHRGPCQRIAHGHRSRIEIEVNGQRSQHLEYQWARRWRDIYLVSREDIHAETEINGVRCLDIRYDAQEGAYRLLLPAQRAYILDSDTTVEHIADHIANALAGQHPDSHIRVRAFEGINKGAIAERGSARITP
ncbi:MAG: 6-pyruvoyl tetrahydropterin reductase [Gammaproteobacteria bacterium]|nr:MAG: 6-pyruvoyl tetrahydropterin reductase [Gammaproteobacteria bacterium]